MTLKSAELLFVTAMLTVSGSSARAQGFPWNDFQRRTMGDLIEINNDESAEDFKRLVSRNQIIARLNILPSVVRLTYTGEVRKIGESRSKFIELWSGVASQKRDYVKLFKREFLFKEGSEEYWFPVQESVTKYFDKELTKGDAVDLYLIRPGGMRTDEKTDWIFLVEEFQKPEEKEWPDPRMQGLAGMLLIWNSRQVLVRPSNMP